MSQGVGVQERGGDEPRPDVGLVPSVSDAPVLRAPTRRRTRGGHVLPVVPTQTIAPLGLTFPPVASVGPRVAEGGAPGCGRARTVQDGGRRRPSVFPSSALLLLSLPLRLVRPLLVRPPGPRPPVMQPGSTHPPPTGEPQCYRDRSTPGDEKVRGRT